MAQRKIICNLIERHPWHSSDTSTDDVVKYIENEPQVYIHHSPEQTFNNGYDPQQPDYSVFASYSDRKGFKEILGIVAEEEDRLWLKYNSHESGERLNTFEDVHKRIYSTVIGPVKIICENEDETVRGFTIEVFAGSKAKKLYRKDALADIFGSIKDVILNKP